MERSHLTRKAVMELLHQPQDIIAQKYRIIDTLGQGGSGTTYEAEDLQTNQLYQLPLTILQGTAKPH